MKKPFHSFLFFVAVIVPRFAFAIDNPDGTLAPKLIPDCAPHCSWVHLIQLANNLLNFMIYFAVIIAAVMFAYAGYLYMSDGGSMSKVKEAHVFLPLLRWGL